MDDATEKGYRQAIDNIAWHLHNITGEVLNGEGDIMMFIEPTEEHYENNPELTKRLIQIDEVMVATAETYGRDINVVMVDVHNKLAESVDDFFNKIIH